MGIADAEAWLEQKADSNDVHAFVDMCSRELNEIKSVVNTKASASDVAHELQRKANLAEIQQALEQKANILDVNESLKAKANKQNVVRLLLSATNDKIGKCAGQKDYQSGIGCSFGKQGEFGRRECCIVKQGRCQ